MSTPISPCLYITKLWSPGFWFYRELTTQLWVCKQTMNIMTMNKACVQFTPDLSPYCLSCGTEEKTCRHVLSCCEVWRGRVTNLLALIDLLDEWLGGQNTDPQLLRYCIVSYQVANYRIEKVIIKGQYPVKLGNTSNTWFYHFLTRYYCQKFALPEAVNESITVTLPDPVNYSTATNMPLGAYSPLQWSI